MEDSDEDDDDHEEDDDEDEEVCYDHLCIFASNSTSHIKPVAFAAEIGAKCTPNLLLKIHQARIPANVVSWRHVLVVVCTVLSKFSNL